MATLTPTLSLVSTDLSSDELNFSVTDTLTVKAPSQGISTYIAADNVGANNIVVPPQGADNVTYFYCRHTGLTGSGTTTTTVPVDVEETGDAAFARLGPGEWMYLPFCHNGGNVGIQFQVTTDTAVQMEYAFFTKG
tara:strand:+ start:242 stop:649 length:408 start_codon:yes stop_codon:yes gene_type:complete